MIAAASSTPDRVGGRRSARPGLADSRFGKWDGYGQLTPAETTHPLIQGLRYQTRWCWAVLKSMSFVKDGYLVSNVGYTALAAAIGSCHREVAKRCVRELLAVNVIEKYPDWGYDSHTGRVGHLPNQYRIPLLDAPRVELPRTKVTRAALEARAGLREQRTALELADGDELLAEERTCALRPLLAAARDDLLGLAKRAGELPAAPEPVGVLRYREPDAATDGYRAFGLTKQLWGGLRDAWAWVDEALAVADGTREPHRRPTLPGKPADRHVWQRAFTEAHLALERVAAMKRLMERAADTILRAAETWGALVKAAEPPAPASDVSPRRRWKAPLGVKATADTWRVWRHGWELADAGRRDALRALGFDPDWPDPPT